MSEDDELQDALNSAIVAGALKNGDVDALAKIMDLFQDAGLSKNTVNFVLGIIWELLPENAREKIVATTEAEGKNNVIDFFTRKSPE